MRRAYWGACAESLNMMVKLLKTAKEKGYLENTVVIYTSDHGEMSLEHHQDWKNSMYDPSSRVPLIIAPFNVPGLDAKDNVVTRLTSHLDILPTLAELAEAKLPPGPVRGSSLVPFLKGESPERKDFVAMEYHSNLGNTGSFALRQGPYKLITFGHTFPWYNESAYTPMLYNLNHDPYELSDISLKNPGVVKAMTELLENELGDSIKNIDGKLQKSALELYDKFFFKKCTGESLLKNFQKNFRGIPPHLISNQVLAWSGNRPEAATGHVEC